MHLMALLMVAPILALLLFYYLPLGTALPIYILILIVSVFCNIIMVWAMRARAKTGVNAMIGKKALVIRDIDPEGKVEIRGEIWMATGGNKKIAAGNTVKILRVKGLVLIVEALNENEDIRGCGRVAGGRWLGSRAERIIPYGRFELGMNVRPARL